MIRSFWRCLRRERFGPVKRQLQLPLLQRLRRASRIDYSVGGNPPVVIELVCRTCGGKLVVTQNGSELKKLTRRKKDEHAFCF